MAVYFIRSNGESSHCPPCEPKCFVPNATPDGKSKFELSEYCIAQSIARIGWPDSGNLRYVPEKVGALAQCYAFDTLKPIHRKYLLAFRDIAPGDLIITPHSAVKHHAFLGRVTRGYHYEPVNGYYEAAHRVSVDWLMNGPEGLAIPFEPLKLAEKGFPVIKAFAELTGDKADAAAEVWHKVADV